MLCSVLEHSISSLRLYSTIQKNEAKLTSFVHFEKEMASYRALQLDTAQLPIFYSFTRWSYLKTTGSGLQGKAKANATFTLDPICSDLFWIRFTMARIHSIHAKPVRN